MARRLGRAGRLALALTLLAGAASANDSTAELSVGGLVFVKTDEIEMTSEDLFISPARITVRYSFLNKSSKDQRVLVAFPLPDQQGAIEANVAVPKPDQPNIVDFETTVEGKRVETRLEQRVTAAGIDRTDLLKSYGIPLAPLSRATAEALDLLSPERKAELLRLGLVAENEYDIGQGMKKHLEPIWRLRTTFYWEQVFPAGRPLTVEHGYTPSLGSSAGLAFVFSAGTDEPGKPTEQFEPYRKRFCMEKSFVEAARRPPRGKDGKQTYWTEQRISYILTTGANWAGPIKRFKLTVDKGAPDNLVSFCGQGVKKVGPTRFEFEKADFYPNEDFDVLILVPGQFQ